MEPDDTGGPLRIKGRAISPGVGAFGTSKLRGAEGEEFSRGRTEDKTCLLEDDPVDGGDERLALDVVFELVAAVFLRASKSASAYLGLGAPGGDPSVAPGAEDTGGYRGGSSFSDVNGFLQLVVKDSPASRGFIGVGEESADSGADGVSKIAGEGGFAEPLGDGSLGGPGFLGGAFEYRAPSVVRN